MDIDCSSIVRSGSTGEHSLLTGEERVKGVCTCRETAGKDVFVSVGAGVRSTAEKMVSIKGVKEAEVDAAPVFSPIGGTTDNGMVHHFEILSEAGLPPVFYNYSA